MSAISKQDAVTLHNILDDTVGVFRQKEMPEGAVKFHDNKKSEFIAQYSKEIPESYWFQGVDCPSVTLNFDSTGFNLALSSNESTPVRGLNAIKNANERIEAQGLRIIG